HDGEYRDRHHAACVQEQLDRGEELRVEREEEPGGGGQHQGQVEHRVEEVPGQDHREGRGQQHHRQPPESYRLEDHSAPPPGLAAGALPAAAFAGSPALAASTSGRAAFGGGCLSRRGVPVRHDGSNRRPIWWSRSLSRSSSRRSDVDMSNDFIMMMASVGHTCTHSSQNSQAYNSRVKVLAYFPFSALSISTLMTCGGQMYSQSRQPMQFSS